MGYIFSSGTMLENVHIFMPNNTILKPGFEYPLEQAAVNGIGNLAVIECKFSIMKGHEK